MDETPLSSSIHAAPVEHACQIETLAAANRFLEEKCRAQVEKHQAQVNEVKALEGSAVSWRRCAARSRGPSRCSRRTSTGVTRPPTFLAATGSNGGTTRNTLTTWSGFSILSKKSLRPLGMGLQTTAHA